MNYGANCGANRGANYIVEVLFLVVEMILSVVWFGGGKRVEQLQSYLAAFVVGGLICAIGQLLMDLTSYTPAHILSGFTVAGGILGGFGLYDRLIEFAGAGASLPISSFGNALVKGAMAEAAKTGVIGVLTGMFELTSTGITAAIIFAFLTALVFNPKG